MLLLHYMWKISAVSQAEPWSQRGSGLWEVLSCGNAEKELTAFFQPLPVIALICVRITHLARDAGSLHTNPVTLSVPGSPLNSQSCSSSSIFQVPLAPSPAGASPVPFISSENPLNPPGFPQIPLTPQIPSSSSAPFNSPWLPLKPLVPLKSPWLFSEPSAPLKSPWLPSVPDPPQVSLVSFRLPQIPQAPLRS